MRDKRIDAYITQAEPFARPILKYLRAIVHKTCPEVEETMKWSFPHFNYHGVMCSMAAFKKHCAFSFWKASLMKDKTLLRNAERETAMGHLGKIVTRKDLPSENKLTRYIKEAMTLNENGVKVNAKTKSKPALAEPGYFITALRKNKEAWNVYNKFSPSNKREYLEWIIEAKTDITRQKRLGQAIEWMADGKPRNWKYVNPKRATSR